MDLSQLVKKRGTCKSKLTLFSKFVTSLQMKKELTDLDLFELKERLASVEESKVKFNEIQSEIEEGTDDPKALESQLIERESFDNTYFLNVALARKIINDNDSSPHVPPTDITLVQTQAATTKISNVRLPTISIPKYSGSYHNWLEFRDTFQSLIHKNLTLTGVQKFHYLRASLEGDAAQIITSLELSEANYDVAWDALLERYDNDRLLVQTHVRALFNLEQMQKESASGIRKILDDVTKNIRVLEQLKEPVEHWDTLLTYLVVSKLDNATLKNWENYKSENLHPSFNDLKIFLKGRAEVLEAVAQNSVRHTSGSRDNTRGSSRGLIVTKDAQEIKCAMCAGGHVISTCSNFTKLNVTERMSKARQLRLCLNCLKRGHYSRICRMKPCDRCHEKHHILLHNANSESNVSSRASKENNVNMGEEPSVSEISKTGTVSVGDDNKGSAGGNSIALSACSSIRQVFLSTVQVKVFDKTGGIHVVRALLDSGSQSSFITQDLCKKLGLPTEKVNFIMRGLNQKCSGIHSKCKIKLQAVNGTYECELNCFVLDIITGSLPQDRIDPNELNIPSNIRLADPTFYQSNVVDILIGADLYYDVIRAGIITLGNGPVLQKTRFGWVVAGPMSKIVSKADCYFCQNVEYTESMSELSEIQECFQKFWQLEEVDPKPVWSDDEKACEEHFVKTTTRDPQGRFIVSLPLKLPTTKLGDSFTGARKRFLSLENKLMKKPEFKRMYVDFMREYAELGHMKKVQMSEDEVCYYLPHRGVLREETITTKLRVVFDGSAPTSSGFSLNHLQLAGPTIQQDLFSILLRFRHHKYVVAADIAKIYRQVLINPAERCLQRVLWRENPEAELEVWELGTVTYGTTSAPFLAIRCLFQLAEENSGRYPELAQIIKSDFYVDDLLAGADTTSIQVDDAANICKGIMRVGGRLAHAKFAFEKKHPIILSSDCSLSTLIINDFHTKLLHAGPRHVLVNIREEFWIVGGNRLCKKLIHQCITCYRFKTKTVTPIMAPLPELRLRPSYPFEVAGVDYAGPFMIKSKAGRGLRLSKAYICLFICFTVKAVHLELVHELTKDAFMAALRRFVSRRGKPSLIYSDNGTNFVAASHELHELREFIKTNERELELSVQKEGIEWKFIPPHSPHFGGLWEAGIKSVKFHLKRILKDVNFTFEQFYTILVQVEAILNSRPLSALSDAPEDLVPLTPAHFLVGRPLTTVPEYDLSTVPVSRLSLYQHMQQVVQHLWRRWSKEYVSELQIRSKWRTNQDTLKEGILVLIKEDNQPPLKWKVGRVDEIHPGKDGVTRVATVRTPSGLMKRSFAKLCPLPLEEAE